MRIRMKRVISVALTALMLFGTITFVYAEDNINVQFVLVDMEQKTINIQGTVGTFDEVGLTLGIDGSDEYESSVTVDADAYGFISCEMPYNESSLYILDLQCGNSQKQIMIDTRCDFDYVSVNLYDKNITLQDSMQNSVSPDTDCTIKMSETDESGNDISIQHLAQITTDASSQIDYSFEFSDANIAYALDVQYENIRKYIVLDTSVNLVYSIDGESLLESLKEKVGLVCVDLSQREIFIKGTCEAGEEVDIVLYKQAVDTPEGSLSITTDPEGAYSGSIFYSYEGFYGLSVRFGVLVKNIILDTTANFEYLEVNSESKSVTVRETVENWGILTSRSTLKMSSKDANGNDLSIQHLGQVESKDVDYTFNFPGAPSACTLTLVSADGIKQCLTDTAQNIIYTESLNKSLIGLPESYGENDGETVRDRFFNAKNELPEEMPVVEITEKYYEKNIFVSNSGSDTNNGTIISPYKTIEKAFQGCLGENTRIYLREGNYFINKTININNISNVTIEAYNDESVSITRGYLLNDAMEVPVSDARINSDYSDEILCYDISSFGFQTDCINYKKLPVLSSGENHYSLARWPNNGTVGMTEYAAEGNEFGVVDSGPYLKASGEVSEDRLTGLKGGTGFEFVLDTLHPLTWQKSPKAFMCGAFFAEYRNGKNVEIKDFDYDLQSVITTNTIGSVPTGARYSANNKFYFFNVLEELDMPGEWYFDAENNKIYIYPPSSVTQHNYCLSLPESDSIFSLNSVKNISFINLNFTNLNAIPVSVNGGKNIIVKGCEFNCVQNDGVKFENCEYSGVIESIFKDVSGSQLTNNGCVNFTSKVESCTYKELRHQYNFVQNNYVYNSAMVYVEGVGVIVSHNVFSNMPRNAVYLSYGAENVVEYNEFIATPTVSDDCGVVYINGGPQRNLGNHIRYNYFHDCKMDRTGSNVIYLDEMASYNYVYGNILKDRSKIFMHSGSENSIYNNVFIDNDVSCIKDSENHLLYFSTSWYEKMSSLYGWFAYLNTENNMFDFSDEIYELRYPSFYRYAGLMLQRAEEYQNNSQGSSSTTVNYSNGSTVNLDIYLRAPRDNHIENNIFINSPTGLSLSSTGLALDYLNDNVTLSANPFDVYGYEDVSAYYAIRNQAENFETINFSDIGLSYVEKNSMQCEGVSLIYPVNNANNMSVSSSIEWKSDIASAYYLVEISEDEDFSELCTTATTYKTKLSFSEIQGFSPVTGETYYWRVTTIPKSLYTSGQIISDVYSFTIAEEVASNYQKHIINLAVENMMGVLNNPVLKLCDAKSYDVVFDYVDGLVSEPGTVYIACMRNNVITALRMMKTNSGTQSGTYRVSINDAEKTDKIQTFIWGDNLRPLGERRVLLSATV